VTISSRLGVSLVLIGLSVSAPALRADDSAAPAPTTGVKRFTRSRAFRLPFTINENAAAGVSQVRLYVQSGPGAAWTLKETAAPSQKYFTFVAPQDGEYAFLIATVDQAGRVTPADVPHEAPDLVVVVSTQPAEPAVHPAATDPSGGPAASEVHSTAAAAPAPGPAAPSPVEAHADKIASPLPATQSAPPSRYLINSTHATLNYQVEAGGAATGKIEVWLTSPNTRTWRRLAELPDQSRPAEIDLPGEGVFGLSLMASTGADSVSPAAGAAPDLWVEVDTTQPQAQLLPVTLDSGAGGDSLVIRWNASDKNLEPRPIHLYYAVPDGRWQPIAAALANEGIYRWLLPRDLGPVIYVRMEVTDAAGNCCRCEPSQPFTRYAARPKVRVLGIAAGASRTTPPQGN
jgi:hypothetical protein